MNNKDQNSSPYETSSPYGDGDIPEIDLPGKADATPDIPNEFPGRNQSGQKQSG